MLEMFYVDFFQNDEYLYNQSLNIGEDRQLVISRYVFFYVCLAFIPINLFTNVLSIGAVALYPGFHRAFNYLLLGLAFSDFILGVYCMPLYIVSYMPAPASEIFLNRFVCASWLSAMGMSGGGTLYSILFISVDRFIAVIRPWQYPQIMARDRTLLAVVSLWIYISLVTLAGMFVWNTYASEATPVNLGCNFKVYIPKYALNITSFVTVFVTSSLSLLLYVDIITKTRRQREIFQSNISRYTPRQIRSFETRARSVGIATSLTASFVFLWLPYFLLVPFKYSGVFSRTTYELFKVTLQLLQFSNSLVKGPVFYFLGGREYKDVYRAMASSLPWKWKSELKTVSLKYERDKNHQHKTPRHTLKVNKSVQTIEVSFEQESGTSL